ncbi:MAG: sigma 54-interacting transcriptional regulator [Myxococcota bacterium]|nr:sigma 54-interacting transcriptional regulator [Myxococcota bacterium]
MVEIGNSTLVLQHCDSLLNSVATGHLQFEQRLQQQCVEAARTHAKFAMLMIEVTSAVPGGDAGARIRALMRPDDFVAEYAPGHFEILVRNVDRKLLTDLIRRLREELGRAEIKARIGASVFPTDGRAPDELMAATLRELNSSRGRAEPSPSDSELGPIVEAPNMVELHQLIDRVATANITVLITGETGTGKEVIAEAVHGRSPRSRNPFVKLNCASVPEQLLEAELFGYERGAFTGATSSKVGLLEHANGGSMLLDEMGEMPLDMQAKLLRVIEEKKIRRVGGLEPVPVDVRIIASTNRDLERMVASGKFREDLYWRLCAVVLTVPPLRDRIEEILPLAERFLTLISRDSGRTPSPLSPEARDVLRAYGWPGNIRQLRNVMERASLLASGGEILPKHLPPWSAAPKAAAGAAATTAAEAAATTAAPLKDELNGLERDRILDALEKTGQNQTRAAELLSMPRRTFVEKLDRYGIARPRKGRST